MLFLSLPLLYNRFMSYRYIKAPPGYTLQKPEAASSYLRKAISAVLLTIGIAATTSVAYPLAYYQLKLAPRLEGSTLISPAVTEIRQPLSAIPPVKAAEPTFLPEMINTTLDYTDPDTWFPDAKLADAGTLPETTYSLAIPALNIKNATVVTTHSDLKKSLIHYPGTAMPGDLGNTVIFGHSVLPQFFNPKNYISIFSTLHTLTQGDEIVLTSDNVEYRYQISDIYEVMPDNLTPLAQSYGSRRLTLITCTPPGTYLRRLIVKADLL